MLPHGLQPVITRSYPALRPELLDSHQAALWSTLPPIYREFLCRWNGGVLDEDQLCFDTPIPFFKDGQRVRDLQTDSVVELYGFRPSRGAAEPGDLAEVRAEHEAREFLPSGVLAVAECVGDSLVCVSTRREDFGAVYYWDYYWKYPWCRPFFDPRVEAAAREFPDIDTIRTDPRHPRRQEAADALNYATLVRLADGFDRWLSTCRSNVPAMEGVG